jgi:hypothetical protein
LETLEVQPQKEQTLLGQNKEKIGTVAYCLTAKIIKFSPLDKSTQPRLFCVVVFATDLCPQG